MKNTTAMKTMAIMILGWSGATLASTENHGFYFGSAVGRAEAQDVEQLGLFDDTETGYRLYGGYEFTRLLSIELGYVNLGEFSGTIPSIEGPIETEIDLDGFSIGLRPQFALNENWYAQAQAGLFVWESDASIDAPIGFIRESADGEDAYYGLGIGRNLGPNWQISGEWTRYETDESDADFINLAMTWRMDR